MGDSVEYGRAIAAIVIGAALWGLSKPAWDQLDTTFNNQVSNQTATAGLGYTDTFFQNFPLIVLTITFIGVIGYAVYSGGV